MRKTNIKIKSEKIRISVRELVEHVLKKGNLKSSFTNFKRALEGTLGHQIVQQRRGKEYRREVRVSHEVVNHATGIDLVVQGRIDGIYKEEETFVIEEIKTTHKQLEELELDENGLHFAQAKAYAFLFANQLKIPKLRVNLTYYQIQSSKTQTFSHPYGFEELKTFFVFLVDSYLESVKELYDWHFIRDASIEAMEFPFSEYRSGQEEFMKEVYSAIVKGVSLYAQAPTGLGKTISVLFPAIKAIATGHCSKVFYLTARTTTREAPEQTIETLRQDGLRLKSIVITAKEKTCLQDDMVCNPDQCQYLFNYFGKIESAIRDIYSEDRFTRENIESCAIKHKVCPFELSLDLSLVSDCIICDYNYFFDPRIKLARYSSEFTQPFVYLVDEAHNLVERSRSMYSAELEKADFLNLKRAVKKEAFPLLHQCLTTLDKYLLSVRKEWLEDSTREVVLEELSEELIDYLVDFLDPAENLLNSKDLIPFRDALQDLYYRVTFFIKINQFVQETEAYAIKLDKKDANLIVKLLCLDATEMIKEKTELVLSTVFFSATLSPAEYFFSLLGGQESDRYIQLPSPFPEENRCICLADHISTRYRDRQYTYDVIADYLKIYLTQIKGNYMVFFPSFKYLEEVFDRCLDLSKKTELIQQKRRMSEKEREEFISLFTENRENSLVGFVVMGGIFGESIDLPGEQLTGAAIIGVGLPQVNIERDLIRKYFDKKSGNGFHYAYTFPGMNKVMQAAGRLIRTETDKGTLMLVDDRFGNALYKRLFPKEWQEMNIVRDTDRLKSVLTDFWD